MRSITGKVMAACLLLAAAMPSAARPQETVPAPFADEGVLALDRATALALGNSPQLRRQWANVEEARGQMIQAGLYPNPRFDPGNPQQVSGLNTQFSFGLTQHILRGGKLQLEVSAAERALQQTRLIYTRARFDLLTSVRQQFFTLVAGQERISTLEALRSILQRSLQIGQELFKKGGQVPETDVLLLRISLRQIESQLQAAQLTMAGGRQQLASLLGIPGMRIDRVEGNLRVQLPEYTDEYAREAVVARNALLQSAQVDIARNRILLERAQVQPVVDLDVMGGWQYHPLESGNASPALVGVTFDVPLWNRNQGNIRTAQWNVTEAMAVANLTQNDLLRQLAEALARYRAQQILVTNYEREILPAGRRAITLIQSTYEQGVAGLTPLLQAQQLLNQTNLDYIDALLNRMNAAADVANLLQVEQFP